MKATHANATAVNAWHTHSRNSRSEVSMMECCSKAKRVVAQQKQTQAILPRVGCRRRLLLAHRVLLDGAGIRACETLVVLFFSRTRCFACELGVSPPARQRCRR